jgi:hypothetical protein
MKQMTIDEHDLITLDYESPNLPRAVKEFRPTLYKNDEMYCCILGPDPEEGIFGRGATEDEAIQSWNNAFKERLQSKSKSDEVLQYIRDTLATSPDDVW